MSATANYLMNAVLVGTAATALLDLWSLVRKRLFRTPSADYGLVGRWIGHMAHGRFRHDAITASPPIAAERVIGWTAHYLIGVAFAFSLLVLWGIDWTRHPTLAPALIVGIGSVAAPFFLMQPGMGAGVASSRTANPGAARLRSVITHGVFGVCLYAAGYVVSQL
jgi:Protein of unknown function (DUF2938)